MASNLDMINELKSSLEHEFKMIDLNKLHFFIKIHFERNKRACIIILHQQNDIESILKQFGIGDYKPIGTLVWRKYFIAKVFGGTWAMYAQK